MGASPPSGRPIKGAPVYMGLRVMNAFIQLDSHSESLHVMQSFDDACIDSGSCGQNYGHIVSEERFGREYPNVSTVD